MSAVCAFLFLQNRDSQSLNGLFCADVPLRNCSLTHSLTQSKQC